MEQGHIDDDKVDIVAAYRQSKSTPFVRQVKYFQTLLGFTFSLVLCGLVLLVPISLLPWTNDQQGSNLPVLNEYMLCVGAVLPFGMLYMLSTFFNIAVCSTKLFPDCGWDAAVQIPLKRGFVLVIVLVGTSVGLSSTGYFHFLYLFYVSIVIFVIAFIVMDITGRDKLLARKKANIGEDDDGKNKLPQTRRRSSLAMITEKAHARNSDTAANASTVKALISFLLYAGTMITIALGYPLFIIPWFMR